MITPDKLGSTDDPAELADLIDQLMSQGSGKKGACCQPTELEPEDDEF